MSVFQISKHPELTMDNEVSETSFVIVLLKTSTSCYTVYCLGTYIGFTALQNTDEL